MFGSLAMKTLRIYKIFGNKSLKKIKLTAKDTFKTYGKILLIDIAVLVAWKLSKDEEGRGMMDLVKVEKAPVHGWSR